jgi:hypothetical protein
MSRNMNTALDMDMDEDTDVDIGAKKWTFLVVVLKTM